MIRNYIYKIVLSAMKDENEKLRANQLDYTSDLARLIMDVQKGKLSLRSHGFLCRMDVEPKLEIKS